MMDVISCDKCGKKFNAGEDNGDEPPMKDMSVKISFYSPAWSKVAHYQYISLGDLCKECRWDFMTHLMNWKTTAFYPSKTLSKFKRELKRAGLRVPQIWQKEPEGDEE
tara:strand:- start:2221 stop:2544 length:324 start_codon:yes stop_codon:yes gene_type:complete